MPRAFKYILLGLGACLIIASGITESRSTSEQTGMNMQSPGGKDFVLDRRDELLKPVEDYTRESPKQETGAGEPNKEGQSVYVTIPKGARGSDVAALLLESGLIKDKGEFEKQLVELKLDRRIIYGVYSFEKDEGLTSIISRITTHGE